MHYWGTVTQQLTHEDLKAAVARQQARQRRDARRARHEHPAALWPAFLTREPGAARGDRKHLRFLDWHGVLSPHHR